MARRISKAEQREADRLAERDRKTVEAERQAHEQAAKDSWRKATGADEPARPPIVGADLWTAVVAAADGQCQCRGECGRSHHKDPGGRCAATNTAARPLQAVPTVVVSVARAVTLPAEAHRAYCPPCHHGLALRTARRQRAMHDRHRHGDLLF